ncbi:MAG: membrane protein insertion efficiency factor YidD [Sphingomonadaceae bacterium]|nr:MAG: membrane protein insertion efficiency factor YidD [Sphingomonadaceae bacterium]
MCESAGQDRARRGFALATARAPKAETVIARLLILIARGWQLGPSLILPPSCRYQPSCSAYAITALRRYGAVKGGWLAVKRIARCHPWGGHGPDPVP